MGHCVRLGFVVNPVAGSGGPLALKGSDGLACAAARGWAAARAARALRGLAGTDVTLLTGAGAMGEALAVAARLAVEVVHRPPGPSSAADTTACVAACVAAGAQLIAFAGGDGTARDVLAAAPAVPVLGVPAGVKMHSGVFATSPAAAAGVLADAVRRPMGGIAMAEVLDRDAGGNIILFGQLPVLAAAPRQAAKAMRADPEAALAGALAELSALVRAAPLCLIGPGLTMHRLKTALAGKGTLLGVDVFAHGQLVLEDANAARLLAVTADAPAPLLVLGVIGGQGFLLGRGNQQLAPPVLERVQWPPVIVASVAKLAALARPELLVDTGDERLDARLAGFAAVRTGARQTMMMRIVPA
jgi:predicted polyphosphate/ATP-dependent NAD kinase